MIDYELWQIRLKTEVNGVTSVGFAADLSSVLSHGIKAVPSIFIIPRDERATDRDTTAAARSMVTVGIDVLMIAFDAADGVGGQAKKGLRVLRQSVFDTLQGWQPPDTQLPVHFRAGKRVAMHKGLLIWADTYECKHLQ